MVQDLKCLLSLGPLEGFPLLTLLLALLGGGPRSPQSDV